MFNLFVERELTEVFDAGSTSLQQMVSEYRQQLDEYLAGKLGASDLKRYSDDFSKSFISRSELAQGHVLINQSPYCLMIIQDDFITSAGDLTHGFAHVPAQQRRVSIAGKM